jgi:hypothetical protein
VIFDGFNHTPSAQASGLALSMSSFLFCLPLLVNLGSFLATHPLMSHSAGQVAGVDDRFQERFRMVMGYLVFREASQVGATSAKDVHLALSHFQSISEISSVTGNMSPQDTKRRIKSFYSLCWRRAPAAYDEPELFAKVMQSLLPV